MKIKNTLSLILIILYSTSLFSQNNFDINFPNLDREEKCNYFLQAFQKKPREVKFSIKRENNNLYFEINNKSWFNQLFKNIGDGIAIDVVSKKRYQCEIGNLTLKQIRGVLIKPVYLKQLKKGLRPAKNNRFRVLLGKVPRELASEELEFNILFLNNKNLCQYYSIYNLESYPWELLDMGMYLDSLSYKSKKITTVKEKFLMKYKTLQFIIPFEKNKSEYSPNDIKPLYDSLRLTDFNIKKINIRAYSSIEGSLKRNLELQKKRASSIAKSLQSFQTPNIVTEVFSSENWVEFMNDISGTNYENLKSLSKDQIKRKLVGDLSKELEVYLKNHRKAVVTLDLDKKDKYKNMNITVLLGLFHKSIVEDELTNALEIQNTIFNKIYRKETTPDILTKMQVPRQLKNVSILIKNSAIKYLLDERQLLVEMNELKKLERLDPKNMKIKYNLIVMKFKIWKYNVKPVDEINFEKEILSLEKNNISQVLIKRMLVNYHIIKTEKRMRKRDYKSKEKSVKYIVANYKNFPFSNYDYLSLAQFLSYYENVDLAVALLDKKVRNINVDENLLFYYLNLTIINKKLTMGLDYRTMMLNAVNRNKLRFCNLFNSMSKDGVTFQLLEDEYLRKTYCENCKNQ